MGCSNDLPAPDFGECNMGKIHIITSPISGVWVLELFEHWKEGKQESEEDFKLRQIMASTNKSQERFLALVSALADENYEFAAKLRDLKLF